jgi:hypothetical protein
LLLLGWWLAAARRVNSTVDWFCFSTVTAFAAHALVEYPHAYVYFLVPAAVCVGRLEIRRHSAAWRMPVWAAAAAVGAVGCAAAAIVADYLPLAEDRPVVQMWLARVGGQRELPPAPRARVLDHMEAAARLARVVPAVGMTDEQLAELEKVSRRFPTIFFLRQLSLSLALNGRFDEAATELHRLRGLHGERFYRAALEELEELAATSRPELRPLLALLRASEPALPTLPRLR